MKVHLDREDITLFWPRYDDKARVTLVFSFNSHLLQKCCCLVSSCGETIVLLLPALEIRRFWQAADQKQSGLGGWFRCCRARLRRLTVVLGVEDGPAGFWAGERDCVHTSFISCVTPFDWSHWKREPGGEASAVGRVQVWLTPAESCGSELRRFKTRGIIIGSCLFALGAAAASNSLKPSTKNLSR